MTENRTTYYCASPYASALINFLLTFVIYILYMTRVFIVEVDIMMSLFLLHLSCASPPPEGGVSRTRGDGTSKLKLASSVRGSVSETASPVGSGNVSETASPVSSRSPSVAGQSLFNRLSPPSQVNSQSTTPRGGVSAAPEVMPPKYFFESHEKTIAELRKEVAALVQQHTALNAALAAAAAAAQDNKQALSTYQEKLFQAQAEFSAKQRELEDKTRLGKQVETQLLAAQAENLKKESQLEQQRSQIDTLEAKISELEEQSRKQIEKLTATIGQLRMSLEKGPPVEPSQQSPKATAAGVPPLAFGLAARNEELKAHVAKLQESIAIMRHNESTATKQLIECQATIALLQREVDALKEEKNSWNPELSEEFERRPAQPVDTRLIAMQQAADKALEQMREELRQMTEKLKEMINNRNEWMDAAEKWRVVAERLQPPLKEKARGCC